MTILTSSPNAGGPAETLRGIQTPRILCAPPSEESSGPEVVEYCRRVGLILDPWQACILEHGLAERADRSWAAFEVGFDVPRQNGKGEVLLAREIAGLFLFPDERLILHTAHEFKTCQEAFRRAVTLVENSDKLRRRVAKIRRSDGEEGIELLDGSRLRFLARSTSSGRGFTGDCVILDEAQILGDGPIRALLPTLSSRPNPQLWYAATAGNQQSFQLASIRRRALAGNDRSLAYLEWSVNEDSFDVGDRQCWAQANPALGIRISEDYIAREQAAMSREGFASERLGVGDWPVDETFGVISVEAWADCADRTGTRPEGPFCFAVDVNWERTGAAIAVAARRPDGLIGIEIADQRDGVDWVVDRMIELVNTWGALGVVVDRGGPAGTLVSPLEQADIEVIVPTPQEVAQSAEGFYDAVKNRSIRHMNDTHLDAAVAGAKQRTLGEAWAWGRRSSATDISPLVAASFALWGFVKETANMGQPAVWVL